MNIGDPSIWNGLFDISEYKMELKPLSCISDEDAVEVAKIGNVPGYADLHKKAYREGRFKYEAMTFDVVDYLRSKSYALPWSGYTVDQLQEFGWIKLKQQ